jgi:hypothetical protein
MACRLIGTDRALLVVWGVPEPSDVDLIAEQIEMRLKLTGKPIFYVTRLPIESPVPSPEIRAHLSRCVLPFSSSCQQYHVIIEGDGFVAASKRAVLMSFSGLRAKCGVFFVHGSVQEFERRVSPEWRADVTRLLHLAEQRGLLAGPMPAEPIVSSSGRWFIPAKAGELHAKKSNVA